MCKIDVHLLLTFKRMRKSEKARMWYVDICVSSWYREAPENTIPHSLYLLVTVATVISVYQIHVLVYNEAQQET